MGIAILFGQLIRLNRDKKGMSRAKLAQFTGINPNSLAKYENAGEEGGKYPSAKNLVKICEVLEIDPRTAFDYIKQEDQIKAQQEYHAENPTATPYEVLRHVERGMSFQKFFLVDEDLLNWKLSTTNIEELNSHLDMIEVSNFNLDDRLHKIEVALKINNPVHEEPGCSENTTNETKAVEAASIKKPEETR